MSLPRMFMPESPDDALWPWYRNVLHELKAGWYDPAAAAYVRRYYGEAGLLRRWRRPFFRRHFVESFQVAGRFLLGTRSAPRLVDLGCGAGTQSLWLALCGARVVCVDIDLGALEVLARRRERYEALAGRPLDIRIVLGDALEIDWAGLGPLDGLYSMFAFNMMQPSARVLDRMVPAMAPGFRLAVIDGNNSGWLNRLVPRRRRAVWSPPTFAAELAVRGFDVLSHVGGVSLPPPVWAILPAPVARAADNRLNHTWLWPISHQVLAARP